MPGIDDWYLNASEVARRLDISYPAAYGRIRRGVIPSFVTDHGHRFVLVSALEEYERRQRGDTGVTTLVRD